MTNDTPDANLQALWQSAPAPTLTLSVEEMRARASSFEKKVRRRNAVEYIASAFVIGAFGWYATWPQPATPLWPIANIAIIIGTLIVVWNIRRIGRAATTPGAAQIETLLAFHRGELVRQRDALRTVWLWYLAPFVPGIALWFAALWIGTPQPLQTAKWAATLGGAALFAALTFGAIALLNFLGAERLQRLIDELDNYRE